MAPLSFNPKATVRVRALATLSSWNWQEEPFRAKDHRGRFIVHSIKGAVDKLNGKHETLALGPNGAAVTVTHANFELIADYWAQWAAHVIQECQLPEPIVLTPLPSSQAVPTLGDYRSLNLARRAQAHIPGSMVWDGVRFRQARQPVHSGGSRSTISEDMILTSQPPAGAIVPIDDVYTTGAHLNGLLRLLPPERRPSLMVVGGKTENSPPAKVVYPPEHIHTFWG